MPRNWIYICLSYSVNTFAISSVILPFADVHISIGVDKSAESMSQVVLPVAFVNGAIFPDLHTAPTALIALPLTLVHIPVLEQNRAPMLGTCILELALLVLEVPELLLFLLGDLGCKFGDFIKRDAAVV